MQYILVISTSYQLTLIPPELTSFLASLHFLLSLLSLLTWSPVSADHIHTGVGCLPGDRRAGSSHMAIKAQNHMTSHLIISTL